MYFFFFFWDNQNHVLAEQTNVCIFSELNFFFFLKKGSVIELFQSYKFQVLECKYGFFPLEQD